MNIYSFIPFISGLLSLSTGIFIFIKSRKSYLSLPYFLSSLAISSYCFFQMELAGARPRVSLAAKLLFVGASFIAPALLGLLLRLERKKEILLSIIFITTLLLAFFSLLWLSPDYNISFARFDWGISPLFEDPPYFLFLLNCLFFLPIGSVVSWIQRKQTKHSELLTRQVIFTILGIFIVVLGMFLNFGPSFGISFYPAGAPLLTIAFIFMGYTIAQYRLLEFDIILNRTMLAFLFVGPLLILHIFVSAFFLKVLGFFGATTFSLLVVIAVIMFSPYRDLTQKFVETMIYRGRYNYQRVLRDLSRSLSGILDFDQLIEYITHVIVQTIEVEKAAFFLENEESQGFVLKSGFGVDLRSKDSFLISSREEIVHRLHLKKKIEVREELRQFEDEAAIEKLFQVIPQFEIELIAPLFFQERLIGFICLGPKQTGHIYNQGDIDVLGVFMHEAAKAIEHVRLYREAIIDSGTKTFNKHYFLMRLREEIARAKRYEHPISLMFVRIDNYENIESVIGYNETEQILRKVMQHLKKKLRNVDILARYNSSTFGIIMPDAAQRQEVKKVTKSFLAIAQRVRANIEDFKSAEEGKVRALNASIGVAHFDGQDKNFNDEKFIAQTLNALLPGKEQLVQGEINI